MSPKPPDLPKKKNVFSTNESGGKSPTTPVGKPLTTQYNAKLLSDAKQLADAVLQLSQEPKSTLPVNKKINK